jgi:hypothetical protein
VIEIVKALVDLLARAVPALSGARHNRKLKAVGADLFLLYFRLNEIIVTAERIVRSLEVYAERMSRHLADGSDAHALTAGRWIRDDLVQQAVNLRRMRDLLRRREFTLVLLDADTYNELTPLLDLKGGAIETLLVAIERGTLPASPSSGDLSVVLATTDMWNRDPDYDRIVHHVSHDGIPLDRPWDADVFRVVTAYLRKRDPRAQLAEIRAVVAQLRTTLLQHFAVEDMLLVVGDERFGG